MNRTATIICLMILLNTSLFSAISDHYQFISPLPGSINNSRESTIIVRQGSTIDPLSLNANDIISVVGTKGGAVSGDVIFSKDNRTIIFKPHHQFLPNEDVTVTIQSGIKTIAGKAVNSGQFSFKVTPFSEQPNIHDYINTIDPDNYTEVPSLSKSTIDSLPANYPQVTVDVYDTMHVDDGYIFMSIAAAPQGVGYYTMMLNNDGTPFYYKEFDKYVYDFKIQPNGYFSYGKTLKNHPFGGGGDVIWMVMDNNLTEIDSVQMGNGYLAECHDFRMLPNGHYLLFGYYLIPYDMSTIVAGGFPNAMVSGTIVQELDQDKNVVFQWRAWDHYDFKTFSFDPSQATREIVHEFHVNSIDLDTDNNIIISTPTWAKKINRQTGDIMWHIGGSENEYSFVNVDSVTGVDYIAGHTFYRILNGNILLFDNGSFVGPKTGMAHEFSLDEVNKQAELVWSYIPEAFMLSMSMGSAQRMPNGNTVVGWGSGRIMGNLGPAFTEVDADGNIVYELSFAKSGVSSYRAYRFPFTNGEPCADVIRNEVSPGNTFDFNDVPDANTGVSIKINSFDGSGYNFMQVKKYNYAPNHPTFPGRAPRVIPQRIVMSGYEINNINADIQFDAAHWGIKNPENTIVYYREFEGQGLFLPLATTYNHVTGKLTATTTRFGEFILTMPDLESIVYAPMLVEPADQSEVNEQLPVTLRWNPVGYATGYALQVITDTPIIDIKYLEEEFYTIESLDMTSSYSWRVKAFNDTGESEWSEEYKFMTTHPAIKLMTPNGGEQWQRGLEYFIRWDDNIDEDVVLELYKADEFVKEIAVAPSDRAYKWAIDANEDVGLDYSLIVKSSATALADTSDLKFTIMDTTYIDVKMHTDVPNAYALHQNYPNPFNPLTRITFDLLKSESVTLTIYDMLGKQVEWLANGTYSAGSHTIQFDATRLSSGIYLYKLETPSFAQTRKMMLMK